MKNDQVVQSVEDISTKWLSDVLNRRVVRFEANTLPRRLVEPNSNTSRTNTNPQNE